ncbi:hypothetical protein [Saccharothrix lopnurensis]|uniref:PD-(D/E)XK nuclease superfamily protein n=1 Tax=Saccharothrix lopnurensis TaxID=1670621 RepID=A0ABW1NXR5_9PSEU
MTDSAFNNAGSEAVPDPGDALPARSGTLSKAERRAAVGAAITVVGRYFSTGRRPMAPLEALGHREDLSGEGGALLAALRLRVALAAARRLRALLERILGRATFRYHLQPEESTGQLSGTLDVNRYITRLGMITDVPTYPVLVAQRSEQTPENVLATYAAQWVLAELRAASTAVGIPATGEERKRCAEERQALERVLRLPAFHACWTAAKHVVHRRAEQELLTNVRRRLRRREIANPAPYRDLVGWVTQVLIGEPVAEPGDLEWEFYYGEKFDSKLFELWCLHLLVEEISAQLVVPVPDLHLQWRRGRAAYTWYQYSGTLEVYFQRSPASISPAHRPLWYQNDEPKKVLGGVPDIVIRAVLRDGTERFAIIDPKLRQRLGLPSDELYKILGYQSNFSLAQEPLGAILHHSTAAMEPSSVEYRSREGVGSLFAIELTPASHVASREAVAPLVTVVLDMLAIPRLDVLIADDQEGAEQALERGYRAAKEELKAYGAALPQAALNHSRRRMRVELGDERWSVLGESVQTMFATADYIGFSLLADDDEPQWSHDFSGAIIGICAGVERILHDHVITPATMHDEQLSEVWGRATLGQVITLVEKSAGVNFSAKPEFLAVRNFLDNQGFASDAVADLTVPLRRLSQRYRNPAAHRTVVHQNTWRALWCFAVTEDRLLTQVIDTFARPAAPKGD